MENIGKDDPIISYLLAEGNKGTEKMFDVSYGFRTPDRILSKRLKKLGTSDENLHMSNRNWLAIFNKFELNKYWRKDNEEKKPFGFFWIDTKSPQESPLLAVVVEKQYSEAEGKYILTYDHAETIEPEMRIENGIKFKETVEAENPPAQNLNDVPIVGQTEIKYQSDAFNSIFSGGFDSIQLINKVVAALPTIIEESDRNNINSVIISHIPFISFDVDNSKLILQLLCGSRNYRVTCYIEPKAGDLATIKLDSESSDYVCVEPQGKKRPAKKKRAKKQSVDLGYQE